MRSRRAIPVQHATAAAAIVALVAAGCGRMSLVLPVRPEPETLSAPFRPGPITGYESAARVIAAIIVTELALPLPRQLTAFVYPSRAAYEQGLVRMAGIQPVRAAEIADYSVGLGHHRQLFINDEALRGAPRSDWLGVVAHELAHAAKYELSGGRRGKSEQWLREGMADWVRFLVLETIPQSAMERLQASPWLGNARELENVIERAVIVSSGPQLELGDGPPAPVATPPEARVRTLEELERDHIVAVLESTGWRVSGPRGAARLLGLKPTTLEARMKKLEIKRKA